MQKEIAELKQNFWESMPADLLVAACTIGACLRAPPPPNFNHLPTALMLSTLCSKILQFVNKNI